MNQLSSNVENEIIHIAQQFSIKMNEIETFIHESSNSNKDSETNYFDEYNKLYQPIFLEFATSKKRVYGGQANSFGKPTRYDGINSETIGIANVKSKNKAEVYFKTENMFKAEYLFVLHLESEAWKIDNVKYKWYNNEKWKPLIM